jgi:hypothetical protein
MQKGFLLFEFLIVILSPLQAFSDSEISFVDTPCAESSFSTEELEFISDFNDFIERVSKPLTSVEIEERFFSSGGPLSKAEYILLGESHVDYPSRVDQARALQALVQPRDFVFYEGVPPHHTANNDSYFYKLYILEKIAENVEEEVDFQELTTALSVHYLPVFERTRAHLNLHNLGLRGIDFDAWDNKRYWADEKEKTDGMRASMILRNSEMASIMEIMKSRVDGSVWRAFFIAGAKHLPSGDLKDFKDWCSILTPERQQLYGLSNLELDQITLPRFYRLIEETDNADFLRLKANHTWGSTKKIYDFLQKANYIELIPKVLMVVGQHADRYK